MFAGERIAEVSRKTKETDIHIKVNLDGTGKCDIETGLGFFDHMLEQIGKHGMMDLTIHTKGDLEVDEHHTIEDTAIALGDCILQALGDKRGIERYGYCLPMDDCFCSVALDFGGRPGLYGMPRSSVRRSARCQRKCSYISSRASAMQPG